jgi:acyl carrier protein
MIDAEKVCSTIALALGLEVVAVQPESRLGDLAELDSLSLVEIATAIDSDFNIRLPGEALTDTLSVNDVMRMIEHAPRQ